MCYSPYSTVVENSVYLFSLGHTYLKSCCSDPTDPLYKRPKKNSRDCYVGGLVAEMAANAWLSVIAKKGAVVVYPRTIRCQQWNDTFGMVI